MRTRLALALVLSGFVGCASPPGPAEVADWQLAEQEGLEATAVVDLGELEAEIAKVDALRNQDLDLGASRQRCLALLLRHPSEPEVLWRVARAEADQVVRLRNYGAERRERDLAALSGLDYAQRAHETSRDMKVKLSPDLLAWLAWALGTTTHLQPMGERADHARKTRKAAEIALELDPDQVTAIATQATVHLRLATLPWIARVFASDIPESSLEEAVALAHRCVDLVPSLEHRLLLAKCLVATGEEAVAVKLLGEGLGGEDRFARDREVRSQAAALHADLSD